MAVHQSTQDPALIQSIHDLSLAGWSQDAIAAHLHVHHRTVQRHQKSLGLAKNHFFHKTSIAHATAKAQAAGYANLEDALHAMAPQYTAHELSRRLGVTPKTMRKWLAERNLIAKRFESHTHPRPKKIQPIAQPAASPHILSEEPSWTSVPLNLIKLAIPHKIRLRPGERWCLNCGETVSGNHCERCGAHNTIIAESILHPTEWERA